MESFAKSIDIMKQSGNGCPSKLLWINISTRKLLDRLLFLIKPAVEYIFGMHIGFALGWLTGLCVGHSYVKYFEPVYLNDLSRLTYWREAPFLFARHGALTGLTIGVIVIALINSTLLNQRIISLCEKNITNPNEIAGLLGKRVGQIERTIDKLVKKGTINRK